MATAVRQENSIPQMQQKRVEVCLRLATLRRRIQGHLLLEGLLAIAASAVFLAAISLVLDRFLRPDLAARLALLAFFISTLLAVAYFRLVRPLRVLLTDLVIADLIDRRRPGVGQRIANVLQLPDLLASDLSASPAMICEAVLDDARALEQIDLFALLNTERRRNVILVLLGIALLVFAFCWWFHGAAGLWSRRWFAGSNVRWPQSTYLSVLGLNDSDQLLIPRGETALLQVTAEPKFMRTPKGWQLSGRGEALLIEADLPPASQIPGSVSIEYQAAEGTKKRGNFTRFEGPLFRYELPPLTSETLFTIRGGDDWLGPVRLVPIDRPAVKSLTIISHSPGSSEPFVQQAGTSDVQLEFLPTTKIELQVQSDQSLADAKLLGRVENLPVLKRVDDTHYIAKFQLQEQSTFEFQLTGQTGGLASKPYFLTLGILNDRAPRLTIRSTGVGRRITPSATIPLTVRAMDDFGLAEMNVELEQTAIVELKPSTKTHKPFVEHWKQSSGKLPTDVQREPELKLAQWGIAAGNTLRLRATGADQCALGVHQGESRWLPFQVVTHDELFYEVLMRQREQRARFAKALEMARGQLQTLNTLATPADRSSLSRVHQVVAQQVGRIAGQLEASWLEMSLNELGTEQTRGLLKTNIIEPMRELHGNDFPQLQTALQKVLAQSEPLPADREAASKSQEAAIAKMQRILDQMSQWESFVDVVNQLRQITKTQNQVKETTEKIQKQRVRDLFDD